MMYGHSFNISHIEYNCMIYGPGERTIIWFQGCSTHCKGCWNTAMWSFKPVNLIEREDLLKLLLDTKNKNVTILGGEPLDQSDNLLWILNKLKKESFHIMLYTGYEVDEIESSPIRKEICEYPDILIIGRYREEQRNTFLRWRGSSNQKIITKDDIAIDEANEVEIDIDEDGKIVCMGYPTRELLDDVFR